MSRKLHVPVLLFTDGAVEGESWSVVSCGAVLFVPGLLPCVFGTNVPEQVTRLWQDRGCKQVIGQAEVLPVAMAKTLWKSRLHGRQVIVFVDNGSALDAFIKGAGNAHGSRELLIVSAALDESLDCDWWYARVPSLANVADAPSRLKSELLKCLGEFETVVIDESFWAEFAHCLSTAGRSTVPY